MASIRYLVREVDRAVAFYTQRLGFELKQQMGPAFASVSRDALTLWLSGPQSSAARPMPDGRRPEPGGWNPLALEMKALSSRRAALKQAGRRSPDRIVFSARGEPTLADDPPGASGSGSAEQSGTPLDPGGRGPPADRPRADRPDHAHRRSAGRGAGAGSPRHRPPVLVGGALPGKRRRRGQRDPHPGGERVAVAG